MERITVIGSPGAGKTTFSKRLSSRLKLPLHHLDYHFHNANADYQTNDLSWRNKVSELAAEPQWVIDGNHGSTFDVRFARADTIIFLDYPVYISIGRAILRRIRFQNKVREDMPPTWKERLSPQLVKFILFYNHVERPKVEEQLRAVAKDTTIIILPSPSKAEKFLSNL